MARCVFAIVALGLSTLSPTMTAQDRPQGWRYGEWGAVGAAGTPDESSSSRVLLQDSGWAEIKPEILGTSIKLRYAIPPAEGLKGLPPDADFSGAYFLRVRARDNGPSARVLVSIKSANWHTGAVRTLVRFDSDQHEFCQSCGEVPPDASGAFFAFGPFLMDESGVVGWFKPEIHVYWAEVQLIKTAVDGRPGIQALGVIIKDV